MSDDALIEKAARVMACIEPGEDWPTNEALGGNLTGTRDDEYRDAMRDQAREVIEAVRDQITAEALREVDAACDRLCWGDYLGTDGSRHYGAALVPKGGVGRMPGFRDWLRDRADRLDPREGA